MIVAWHICGTLSLSFFISLLETKILNGRQKELVKIELPFQFLSTQDIWHLCFWMLSNACNRCELDYKAYHYEVFSVNLSVRLTKQSCNNSVICASSKQSVSYHTFFLLLFHIIGVMRSVSLIGLCCPACRWLIDLCSKLPLHLII